MSDLRYYLKQFPSGALLLAAYTGHNSDSVVRNWLKRKNIPERYQDPVNQFIQAKERFATIGTNKDKRGVKRKLVYIK